MPELTIGEHRFAVRFNYGDLRRIKREVGVDLLAAPKDNCTGVMALLLDPAAAIDAVWIAIAHDAERCGLQRAAFDAAIGGDEVEAIFRAVHEGLIDFFRHSQSVQEALRKAWGLAEQRQAKLLELAQTVTTEKFDELLERSLSEMVGKSPSGSPAGSASPTTDR